MKSDNHRDSWCPVDAKHGDERDAGVAEWFRKADRFNKTLDEERRKRFKRVKIAILDTGIDMTNQMFDTSKARARLKQREDFLQEDASRTDAHDLCGHGSHCAGLLRRVAPAADIFVARVAKDFESDVDELVVAKAIERACMAEKEGGWDVDIITMSFGFLEYARGMESALRQALNRDKIVFAAASNSGNRRPAAYPAWANGVVCINSTSSDGTPSSSNPVVRYPKNYFATLGENVPSAWIASPPAASHATTRVMSGSSMATPIAAALVSLLLEVAMNPGRNEARDIFEYYLPSMRKGEGVDALLTNVSYLDSGYMVIDANRFFDAADRLELAYTVRSSLRSKYGVPVDTPAARGESLGSPSPSASPQKSQPSPDFQRGPNRGAGPAGPDTQPAHSGSTNPEPRNPRAPSIRDWAYPDQPVPHADEAPLQTSSYLDGKQVGRPQAVPPRRVTEPAGPPVQQEPRPEAVKSHSAPAGQPATARVPTPRPLLFYTLTDGPEHLLPEANSYWRYMTPAGYDIYERIYQECNNKSTTGKVHFTEFTKQFIVSRTPSGTIKAVWARLLSHDTEIVQLSRHPKGLVMATLYMLHLETYRSNLQPKGEDGRVGVTKNRRSLLKGFANWVPCQCGRKRPSCSVEWNFVNDVGMHRGGDPKHCLLAKFLDSGKLSWTSSGKKEEAAKDATFEAWKEMTKRTQ